MLEVRDLEVRYGPVLAVKGLSMTVAAGEIVALVGANGAGKTTTIRAIAGLLPFSGQITYDGRLLKPNTAERNVGALAWSLPEADAARLDEATKRWAIATRGP